MYRPQRYILCSLLGLSLVAGCSPYRGNFSSMDGAPVGYSGSPSDYSRAESIDTGFFVPNEDGGLIHIPGRGRSSPNSGYADAQEIRLKVKELAAQMLEGNGNLALGGLIAVPTSFVDLNNLTSSTQLGRYMAEAMFYELNQRNVPVKEYRLSKVINPVEGIGELALNRDLPATVNGAHAVLVGTYVTDKDGVFVNARLVRASDGRVLRTASMVMQSNPVVARLAAQPPFPTGTMKITSGTPAPAPKAAVKKKTSKKRRTATRRRPLAEANTPSLTLPAQLENQPSTGQIQARQAAHNAAMQPNTAAGVATSGNSTGAPSQNAASGNNNNIYSGPAQMVPVPATPAPLQDNAVPMPGPAKNT